MNLDNIILLVFLLFCLSCQNQTDRDNSTSFDDPVVVEIPTDVEDPDDFEYPDDEGDSDEENNPQEISLTSTEWKLEGLVEAKTSDIKVLVPKDCVRCYSFVFDTDSTASGWIIATYLFVNLRPAVRLYQRTEKLDCSDNYPFLNAIKTVTSYRLINNELRFYYNNIKNYFRFTQRESNN